MAALGGRANVDALIFPASLELGQGDAVGFVRVERDSFSVRIALPVEQDAPASDAMVAPVVLRAFEVGCGADDVGGLGAVVEGLGGHVGEVPEAVPLGAALGVGGPKIIVGDIFSKCFDLVVEGLAGEGGGGGVVEGEASRLYEQSY